ncbi:unnamed protein product [Penicillium camemberti]|uniref:Str. FM013 n=1 Tax=Penicillium camemberti (strain FM 013) TaxID=1429867 RepID=A0A0G4PDG5_PENC3|nr:unnamed protein product [Penicillium camemberti]
MAIPGLPALRNTILDTVTQSNTLIPLINLAKIACHGVWLTSNHAILMTLIQIYPRNRSPP